eukprot:TRINITY_DN2437_c1_g1_i1.p1 TRINITY_DN2437_c1_g1~~TRINITY_DN2437_c1_g1_i1.p1  ORF type:complete len:203 (+),score=31.18 TRINITY_DN2437_c1_g1_i1:266-874(+)
MGPPSPTNVRVMPPRTNVIQNMASPPHHAGGYIRGGVNGHMQNGMMANQPVAAHNLPPGQQYGMSEQPLQHFGQPIREMPYAQVPQRFEIVNNTNQRAFALDEQLRAQEDYRHQMILDRMNQQQQQQMHRMQQQPQLRTNQINQPIQYQPQYQQPQPQPQPRHNIGHPPHMPLPQQIQPVRPPQQPLNAPTGGYATMHRTSH